MNWLVVDHLGSVVNVLDGSGNLLATVAYDGFGNITSQTNGSSTGKFGFTGDVYLSNEGIDGAKYRVYDRESGRWLWRDLNDFSAGDADLYRYAGNNPTDATDTSGLAEMTATLRAGWGKFRPAAWGFGIHFAAKTTASFDVPRIDNTIANSWTAKPSLLDVVSSQNTAIALQGDLKKVFLKGVLTDKALLLVITDRKLISGGFVARNYRVIPMGGGRPVRVRLNVPYAEAQIKFQVVRLSEVGLKTLRKDGKIDLTVLGASLKTENRGTLSLRLGADGWHQVSVTYGGAPSFQFAVVSRS